MWKPLIWIVPVLQQSKENLMTIMCCEVNKWCSFITVPLVVLPITFSFLFSSVRKHEKSLKEFANLPAIVARGPMCAGRDCASVPMAIDRMHGTKHASAVRWIEITRFDFNVFRIDLFQGIGRTCTYDSHCISNAYCKAQVLCACKAEYPLESEDKWYCDGN